MSSNANVLPETSRPPHPLWHRMLFVLWLAWIAALLYMSREEWGRARRDIAPHDSHTAPTSTAPEE
jgi:hypothetical protein